MGEGHFIAWMADQVDHPGVGWPLSGVIAEVAGFRPGRDELPDWLDTFTEHVSAQLDG